MVVSIRNFRAAAVAAVVILPAWGAPALAAPQIKAHPRRVMVGSTVTLRGKGFPANQTIPLSECGRTFWIVPEQACNTENETTVKTNRKGAFKTSFRVEVCPDSETGRGPTEKIRYIGEPVPAEDTVSLLGAAQIGVGYP